MPKPDQNEPIIEDTEIAERIGDEADRKLKRRNEPRRSVWFGLGMFGLVGWAIALPTLIGIGLGLWIDDHVTDGRSWTVALLLAGLTLGCLNAWYWVKKESGNDR
jgi:ATP synthase protein I